MTERSYQFQCTLFYVAAHHTFSPHARRRGRKHKSVIMVSATHLAAAIALAAVAADAFVPPAPSSSAAAAAAIGRGPLRMAAVDDASAQALSDYMAKSHEEKVKAIKAVEDKKNEEIKVRRETGGLQGLMGLDVFVVRDCFSSVVRFDMSHSLFTATANITA